MTVGGMGVGSLLQLGEVLEMLLLLVTGLEEGDEEISFMEGDLRSLAGFFIFFHGGNVEVINLAQEGLGEGYLINTSQKLFFIQTPLRHLSESSEVLVYD